MNPTLIWVSNASVWLSFVINKYTNGFFSKLWKKPQPTWFFGLVTSVPQFGSLYIMNPSKI
jgi:hypothetical protein